MDLLVIDPSNKRTRRAERRKSFDYRPDSDKLPSGKPTSGQAITQYGKKIIPDCLTTAEYAKDSILPRHLWRSDDFPLNPFQLSLSFFPSQIAWKTETIITTITPNPNAKNNQNSRSSMATSFRQEGWSVRCRRYALMLSA
jgi:hypothetical protein